MYKGPKLSKEEFDKIQSDQLKEQTKLYSSLNNKPSNFLPNSYPAESVIYAPVNPAANQYVNK